MYFTEIRLQEDGSYSADSMSVPISEGNRHYKMVQEDIANGATVIPYTPPVPTWEQQMAESDSVLSRKDEDIMDAILAGNPTAFDNMLETLQLNVDKKALRGTKPNG